MTLLATEIHRPGLAGATIIFAADRRITRGTVRDSTRRKIFPIPRLRAGIGYFGLAEVPRGRRTEPMAIWLRRFIDASSASSLRGFAHDLARELNMVVPAQWRRTCVSGFHVCGFVSRHRPEFWYVRNCDDSAGQRPIGRYSAREDFQRRDAPGLAPGQVMVYRNGDIRAHVLAWQRIDQAFLGLLQQPDFRPLATGGDYVRWVRFKMGVIADMYHRFCRVSIIGRPVDAFSIS